jgi:hypothetical protein
VILGNRLRPGWRGAVVLALVVAGSRSHVWCVRRRGIGTRGQHEQLVRCSFLFLKLPSAVVGILGGRRGIRAGVWIG